MHWTTYVKSLSLMGLFIASTASAAVLYEVHDLGAGAFVDSINDAGVMAGSIQNPEQQAAQFQVNRVPFPLDFLPEGTMSRANAINQRGAMVGYSTTGHLGLHTHAFRWTAAQGMQDLGTMGDATLFSAATDLNETETIVGYADQAPSALHPPPIRPVVWIAGHLADLGTLGGANGSADAINSQGDIVWQSQTVAGA